MSGPKFLTQVASLLHATMCWPSAVVLFWFAVTAVVGICVSAYAANDRIPSWCVMCAIMPVAIVAIAIAGIMAFIARASALDCGSYVACDAGESPPAWSELNPRAGPARCPCV